MTTLAQFTTASPELIRFIEGEGGRISDPVEVVIDHRLALHNFKGDCCWMRRDGVWSYQIRLAAAPLTPDMEHTLAHEMLHAALMSDGYPFLERVTSNAVGGDFLNVADALMSLVQHPLIDATAARYEVLPDDHFARFQKQLASSLVGVRYVNFERSFCIAVHTLSFAYSARLIGVDLPPLRELLSQPGHRWALDIALRTDRVVQRRGGLDTPQQHRRILNDLMRMFNINLGGKYQVTTMPELKAAKADA